MNILMPSAQLPQKTQAEASSILFLKPWVWNFSLNNIHFPLKKRFALII